MLTGTMSLRTDDYAVANRIASAIRSKGVAVIMMIETPDPDFEAHDGEPIFTRALEVAEKPRMQKKGLQTLIRCYVDGEILRVVVPQGATFTLDMENRHA